MGTDTRNIGDGGNANCCITMLTSFNRIKKQNFGINNCYYSLQLWVIVLPVQCASEFIKKKKKKNTHNGGLF